MEQNLIYAILIIIIIIISQILSFKLNSKYLNLHTKYKQLLNKKLQLEHSQNNSRFNFNLSKELIKIKTPPHITYNQFIKLTLSIFSVNKIGIIKCKFSIDNDNTKDIRYIQEIDVTPHNLEHVHLLFDSYFIKLINNNIHIIDDFPHNKIEYPKISSTITIDLIAKSNI